MEKFKKTAKIAGNVLLWLFVAFAALMTTLALASQTNSDGIPEIGGNCFLTVSSDSMKGTFNKGDLLFAKKLADEEKIAMKEDDIISYWVDLNGDGIREINTHRIVAVKKDAAGVTVSYTTKGDNPVTNAVNDSEPVRCGDVIARWDGSKLSGVGGFIAFLQQPTGFLVVIVLPLVLLFLWQLFVFIRTLVSVKNSGKRQITVADEELIKQRAIEEYLRAQAAAQNAATTPSAAEPAAGETPPAQAPEAEVQDAPQNDGDDN